MDRVRNPFNPGAGSSPPLLVGRDAEMDTMSVAIRRHSAGRFERSVLLTGLRGVGKTVLLSEFGSIAEREGWIHAHLEVTEGARIAPAIAALARRVLLEWSASKRAKDRARRALGVLRTFVKVHVPLGDGTSLTIDAGAEPGRADSGDLDSDLSAVFIELGETGRDVGAGVLITIDEIQNLPRSELATLIVGLHRVSQLALPVLVAGAGLPSLPGLAGEARSYSERLFNFMTIGSLTDADARLALVDPVTEEGAMWDPEALEDIVRETHGYPYFLQEFGKQAWNVADGDIITRSDVLPAVMLAFDDLDRGFFRSRVDRTTHSERDYLRAMASLGGPGPYRSGDVAKALGRRTTQLGPVRDALIKRGLCFAPRHGELAFTVPMFDEFIRRSL